MVRVQQMAYVLLRSYTWAYVPKNHTRTHKAHAYTDQLWRLLSGTQPYGTSCVQPCRYMPTRLATPRNGTS